MFYKVLKNIFQFCFIRVRNCGIIRRGYINRTGIIRIKSIIYMLIFNTLFILIDTFGTVAVVVLDVMKNVFIFFCCCSCN